MIFILYSNNIYSMKILKYMQKENLLKKENSYCSLLKIGNLHFKNTTINIKF